MKLNQIIFLTFLLLIIGFLSFRFSLSYFSDTAQSTNNVLSASSEFPTQVADHVVISEIQLHGGNANQDFIELYNPKNTSEDLSGWELRLKDAAGTDSSIILIPSGKSIPAHGFFLWANNQGNYNTSIGADVSNGL